MKRLIGALAVTLLGSACGGPPSVADVADTTAQAVSSLIVEGAGATRTLNEVSALRAMDGALRSGLASDAVATSTAPIAEGDAQAQADRAARYLRERIFTEENLEETRGDTLVFRITGEDVCTDGTAPADPACVSAFDEYVLRLTARQVNGELQLGIELGEDRAAPLLLHFTRTSVALDVNLGESKKAYQYLYGKTNPGSTPELPEVLEGVVSIMAAKNGEEDFTVSTSVKQAVRVEARDAQGHRIAFSTEARNPTASLNIVGLDRNEVTFDLDLGRTDVTVPYEDVNGTPVAGRSYTFHLGGASLSLFAKQGQNEVSIGNVSLGGETTTLLLDGAPLLTVDLNANSGRRLDLSIVPEGSESAVCRVNPSFELRLGYHLAPLAQDGHEVDASQLDETYTFTLAGTLPGILPVPANDLTGFPGGLKVLDGTLTLASDRAPDATVTVNASQCLLSQTPAEGSHPLLGKFSVGACE
ncbi:MAG: hypothetical protein WBV82_25240 [Myxococcaceae bacterium]